MTNKTTKAREIETLEALLNTYGADRTRWPARERLRFAVLIAEDRDARRLIAEAAAFDRLLDMAPRVAASRESTLVDRITAAATDASRSVVVLPNSGGRASAVVVDLGSARLRPADGIKGRSGRHTGWAAAGLLAASLMLGVLTGASGLIGSLQRADTIDSMSGEQLALGEELSAGEGDWL